MVVAGEPMVVAGESMVVAREPVVVAALGALRSPCSRLRVVAAWLRR